MKIKNYRGISQQVREVSEVPGFSGYFIGEDQNLYSCWKDRSKMRVVKTWRNKYRGEPYGPPRVTLRDDAGKKRNLYLRDVLALMETKNDLGDLF